MLKMMSCCKYYGHHDVCISWGSGLCLHCVAQWTFLYLFFRFEHLGDIRGGSRTHGEERYHLPGNRKGHLKKTRMSSK